MYFVVFRMKVKVTYLTNFPDDFHGEDIEDQLKIHGESCCMELLNWEISKKRR